MEWNDYTYMKEYSYSRKALKKNLESWWRKKKKKDLASKKELCSLFFKWWTVQQQPQNLERFLYKFWLKELANSAFLIN